MCGIATARGSCGRHAGVPREELSALTFDVEQFKFVTSVACGREIARIERPKRRRRTGIRNGEGHDRRGGEGEEGQGRGRERAK